MTRSPGSTCCARRPQTLPHGRLVVFPGAVHGLRGHLDEALEIAADFLLGTSTPGG